jgi:hypothetical protein
MAFDVRCPECQAKLRLDERPEPGTPIECPRCGSQFNPPKATKTSQPKKSADRPAGKVAGKKSKKDGPTKKKKARKKKTNPFLLLLAIGMGFFGLILVGFAMVYVLNRAGKVEEMLTFVPNSCNWARGINVSQLAKYPGYTPEVAKFMTSDVKAGADELSKAAGQDSAAFVDYLVIAQNRGNGGNGKMYVIRTGRSFQPADFGQGLAGATPQGDGVYRMPGNASGILRNAVVVTPTNRIVVVVPPGSSQSDMVRQASAGKNGPEGSFAGDLDDTGKLVIRGSIWLLVRATGALKSYIADTTGVVKADLKALADAGASAKTFGVWTTPGGSGVRMGAAIECTSAEDASSLVKAMKNGPLGKGDESEPPNSMKQGFSLVSDKKTFSEMMQYLSYRSKGASAYITSSLSGENAKRVMDLINSPSMAAGASAGSGLPGMPPGAGGP